MSGPLIIPVRANGTIAPYPVGAPSGNGMSENDLEGFLAAQGFEVREEPQKRKIGFVAFMGRDEEIRNEKEEETKKASNEGGWHSGDMYNDPVMEPIIKFIKWGI